MRITAGVLAPAPVVLVALLQLHFRQGRSRDCFNFVSPTTTEPLCAEAVSFNLQMLECGTCDQPGLTAQHIRQADDKHWSIAQFANKQSSTLPDLGGTVNPVVPVPAGSNQLLATFSHRKAQRRIIHTSSQRSTSTSVEVDADGTYSPTL